MPHFFSYNKEISYLKTHLVLRQVEPQCLTKCWTMKTWPHIVLQQDLGTCGSRIFLVYSHDIHNFNPSKYDWSELLHQTPLSPSQCSILRQCILNVHASPWTFQRLLVLRFPYSSYFTAGLLVIVLAPALGDCCGVCGTCTSSNSSWETALIVNASAIHMLVLQIAFHSYIYSQTPIQNPNIPMPVRAFLTRYGLRARMRAADCL